jgi:hypothetical protein
LIAVPHRRCRPNAYWRWDLASFSVHIYAARPIAAGEQLSIHYVPLLQSAAARQDQLLDRYIFRCTCSACAASRATRAVSDARRASLRAFVDTPWAVGPLRADASAAVARAMRDARIEEHFFADVWSPALCYAARAALALGDAPTAARCARRAAKLARVVTGVDGGWARVADAPERAVGWRAGGSGLRLEEVIEAVGDAPF